MERPPPNLSRHPHGHRRGGVFFVKGGSKTTLEGVCVVGRWVAVRAALV